MSDEELRAAHPGAVCRPIGDQGITRNGTPMICRLPESGGPHARWGRRDPLPPPKTKRRRGGAPRKGTGLRRAAYQQLPDLASHTVPLPQKLVDQLSPREVSELRHGAQLTHDGPRAQKRVVEKLTEAGLLDTDGNTTERGHDALRRLPTDVHLVDRSSTIVLPPADRSGDSGTDWSGYSVCPICGTDVAEPCWDLRSPGAVNATPHPERPSQATGTLEEIDQRVAGKEAAREYQLANHPVGHDLRNHPDRFVGKTITVTATDHGRPGSGKTYTGELVEATPITPVGNQSYTGVRLKNVPGTIWVDNTTPVQVQPHRPHVAKESQARSGWKPGDRLTHAHRGPVIYDGADDMDRQGIHGDGGAQWVTFEDGSAGMVSATQLSGYVDRSSDAGTDWAAYGPCRDCFAAAGQPCRDLRTAESMNATAHAGRPLLATAHDDYDRPPTADEITARRGTCGATSFSSPHTYVDDPEMSARQDWETCGLPAGDPIHQAATGPALDTPDRWRAALQKWRKGYAAGDLDAIDAMSDDELEAAWKAAADGAETDTIALERSGRQHRRSQTAPATAPATAPVNAAGPVPDVDYSNSDLGSDPLSRDLIESLDNDLSTPEEIVEGLVSEDGMNPDMARLYVDEIQAVRAARPPAAPADRSTDTDWSQYGDCPGCPASVGRPCHDLRSPGSFNATPHDGRLMLEQPAGRHVEGPLTDAVMAAVRDGHVAEVVVYCDHCGVQDRADYTGETAEDRMAAARAHLATRGWTITPDEDLCPKPGCVAASDAQILANARKTDRAGGMVTESQQQAIARKVSRETVEAAELQRVNEDQQLREGLAGTAVAPDETALQRILDNPVLRHDYLRALDRHRRPVPEPEPAKSVDDHVRAAYARCAPREGDWVTLNDLRKELPADLDRAAVDEALVRLGRDRNTMLTPEMNQKTLTGADRDAALNFGGQPQHALRMERPFDETASARVVPHPYKASNDDLAMALRDPSLSSSDYERLQEERTWRAKIAAPQIADRMRGSSRAAAAQQLARLDDTGLRAIADHERLGQLRNGDLPRAILDVTNPDPQAPPVQSLAKSGHSPARDLARAEQARAATQPAPVAPRVTPADRSTGTDWSQYGDCPGCPASAGRPCHDLRSPGSFNATPHDGRPVVFQQKMEAMPVEPAAAEPGPDGCNGTAMCPKHPLKRGPHRDDPASNQDWYQKILDGRGHEVTDNDLAEALEDALTRPSAPPEAAAYIRELQQQRAAAAAYQRITSTPQSRLASYAAVVEAERLQLQDAMAGGTGLPAPRPPVDGHRSDKPMSKNGWGWDRTNPVAYHEDGPVGQAVASMGDDKFMDVDGLPLGEVVGRIATDTVLERQTPTEGIARLKQVRDRLPAGSRGRRCLDGAIDDMDVPAKPLPTLPPQTPAPIRDLISTLNDIPLARGTTRGSSFEGEIPLLVAAAEDFAAGRTGGSQLVDRVRHARNQRHESLGDSGKMHIDAAVDAAVAALKAMPRTSLYPPKA